MKALKALSFMGLAVTLMVPLGCGESPPPPKADTAGPTSAVVSTPALEKAEAKAKSKIDSQ